MRDAVRSADQQLRQQSTATTTLPANTKVAAPPTNKERLFIHFEYHPNDIPRREIRTIYNNHCSKVFETVLDIKQTTVAYSRPKNVRDLITKAKLHQAPGREASKFYTGELSTS